MNRVFVYPNGMVEVEAGYDEAVEDAACFGVEDTEETDSVSDALDVLDEHFTGDEGFRVFLRLMRQHHNHTTWAEQGDPPSLNLGEGAMLRG